MGSPTLGLALIAKDEVDSLPNLLASAEGAFDQVVLLDTGSTDGTVEVFEEWATAEKERQPGFISTIGHFEWRDDFAVARNAADELLETDWLCWADCDDVIRGADRLRLLLETPGVDAYAFTYELDEGEEVPAEWRHLSKYVRERLRRRDAGRWIGRLHESVMLSGFALAAGPEDVVWRHEKPRCSRSRSNERDRQILHRWVEEEPRNLRPLGMLAYTQIKTPAERETGLALVRRYIDLRWGEPEDAAAYGELNVAEWAFRELEWTCRNRDGEAFEEESRPYLVMIIGRRPQSIWSSDIQGVEDRRNPEPAHRPDYSPTPRTRQQRRAEARALAKAMVAK
jgi:glycosyltransferase involved in cell wall biosynthesis